MIIRKPYAFLIKHFKKIHIFLFLICAYIYYKSIQTSSFVREFISLGSYDAYNEPISKYINGLVYLFLILTIAATITIVLLLKYKNKPWKLYLIPLAEYLALLVTFIMTKSFFDSYIGTFETATIRAIRDILVILSVPQYVVFVILIIRILGIDLNKFNFKSDKEFLEMNASDRDEIEINIDIDKQSIKRNIKRFKRNAIYFYKEHQKLVLFLAFIIMMIFCWNIYNYVFVINKSYKEGKTIYTNAYEININNSYYTDKDYKGEKVLDGYGFVILDMTIKNNARTREINFNRFHVMNGINNYTTTYKTYETYFKDLGVTYEKKTIKAGEQFHLIMIFKTSDKLNIHKYVLYYQELSGNTNHLRKIKLKLKDVSKLNAQKEKKLGEELTIIEQTSEKQITFEDMKFLDTITYSKQTCPASGCYLKTENYTINEGYKVLQLSFDSIDFEGKDMIDFLTNYGKINYIDNKDEKITLKTESAIRKTYYGNYVYIKVPNEVVDSKSIELEFTIRNNIYKYKLR